MLNGYEVGKRLTKLCYMCMYQVINYQNYANIYGVGKGVSKSC